VRDLSIRSLTGEGRQGKVPRIMIKPTKTEPPYAAAAPALGEEVQRRNILATLLGVAAGGVALKALTGCAAGAGDSAEDEEIGAAVLALSGNGTVKFADTTSELRAITGGANTWIAVLKGYHAKGDGGGGLFYWDTTGQVDDGGTILNQLVVGSSAGWRRVYSGAVNVRWFGAKGDGTGNDAPVIQKAIQCAMNAGGGTVLLPAGTYPVDRALRVGNRVTLAGCGPRSVVKKVATTYPLHTFNAIQNNGATEPNGCITVHTGAGNVGITIRDLAVDGNKADNDFHCECTDGHGLFFHDCTGLVIEGCEVQRCTNDGIVIQWGDGAVVANNHVLNNNKAGIYLSGAERVTVQGNVCEGNMAAVAVACSWYCTVQGNVTRDNIQLNVPTACGGPGVLGGGIVLGRDSRFCAIVGNATESIVTVPEAFSGERHGITYTGTPVMGISFCVVSGNTVRNKPTDSYGITIAEGVGNIVIGNVVQPSQHGIVVVGAADNKILGNRVHDGGAGWGLSVESSAATASTGNVLESNEIIDDAAVQVMGAVRVANVPNLPAAIDNTIRFNRTNLAAQSYSIVAGNLEYGNVSAAGHRPWSILGGMDVGGGAVISRHLSVQGSVTWAPSATLAPGQHAHAFLSVPGATVGDSTSLGIQLTIAGVIASATVASVNSVMVSVYNPPSSGFQQALPSTVRVDVWQH
jgi:parallel beta-helix repeat protein